MADVDFELQYDQSSVERKTWDSATLATTMTSKHALVFSIAEQYLAIAADFIEQIVELPGIVGVPSAGSSLLGLADHAGHPIPVVDIAPMLNLDSALDDFRHGLLLNHKGLRVMLAIETVVVLRELSNEQGIELPASYQAVGFAQYACEFTNVDAYTSHASRTGKAVLQSSADTDGKPSAPLVVVLDVPQLLTAVQHVAAERPAS